MYLKQFLTNLTIGFRKREIMYGAMPLCSLVYGIMPEQLLFYLNAIILGSLCSSVGLVIFKGMLLVREFFPRSKPYPIEIPELLEVADKMGLELSSQPFWEIDKKTIKAKALGDSKKTHRIIFGKDYLSSLTSEEKKFVGGHEFFHLYGHQFFYLLITIIPTLAFVILIPWALHVPWPVIGMGAFGSIVGCFCFASRSFESIADLNGAAHVSREAAVSALEKAYVGKMNMAFYLHPSTQARIRNLDRYYNGTNVSPSHRERV